MPRPLSEEEWQRLEDEACDPQPLNDDWFNPAAVLPYGLTVEHVASAMQEFLDFLGFINRQLRTRDLPRLESFLMSANFSSMVGEFMNANIPKYCPTLVKNKYHNGHPDLVPKGRFPGDAVQYAHDGVEVKGSRYPSGWQGHNPENVWLMVFHFDSNTAADEHKGIAPKKFKFQGVYAAYLELEDWKFSGRSETSRRTITASVTPSGYHKMVENYIYKDPSSGSRQRKLRFPNG